MSNKKIAIIGAGLAGLTTAYRLNQHGLNVDVFEAKNRVGGRVFTVLMQNYLGQITEVELGAQNITDGGEAANLLNLIKELKLETREKIINLDALVYEEGKYRNFNELIKEHDKTLQDLHKLAEGADNIGHLIELFCHKNIILKQGLLGRMTAYEGVDVYKQSIYHNMETLEWGLKGRIAKFHEVYDHNENEVVTSHIFGGNARLPIETAKHLDGRIHYNKSLAKVTMNTGSVILEFHDKSVYEYDQIVLAIPTSTFKNIDFSLSGIDKNRLFKINSIQYGCNYKTALPLNLNKWNGIRSIIANDAVSFHNHDDTIHILYANSLLLDSAKFAGISARGIGVEIEETNIHPLDALDQNYIIYKEAIQHNWQRDKYAKGSYSGYSTSISEELDHISWHNGVRYKSLFMPINDVLFFVGEHTTILECIGTMEAAVESGERIARALTSKHKLRYTTDK